MKLKLILLIAILIFSISCQEKMEIFEKDVPPTLTTKYFYEDVQYEKGTRQQCFNIRYPDKKYTDGKTPDQYKANNIKVPVIIFLHSGAWIMYSAMSQSKIETPLNGKYAVCYMNYRLLSPLNSNTYMDMMEDIRLCIQYLKDNSQELCIDTTSVGLNGYSAGGHLALLYSYMATDGTIQSPMPVRFVVSKCGPADFTDPSYSSWDTSDTIRAMHAALIRLVVGSDIDESDVFFSSKYNFKLKNASPLTHVTENAPPTFMLYAESDRFVVRTNPFRLRDKLRYLGLSDEDSTLMEVPQAEHGFWNLDHSVLAPFAQAEQEFINRFYP